MNNTNKAIDTFARDNLPAADQLPEFRFDLPGLAFPERLNCATALLDERITPELAERTAVLSWDTSWTYNELLHKANQVAHVLTGDLKLIPGNRVLLSAPNNPMMAACWFAVLKAGGIVVATMPLLRAADLVPIINKAQIDFALCDESLKEELEEASTEAGRPGKVLYFNCTCDTAVENQLEPRMQDKPESYEDVDTFADDVALIAFTSGTTGVPKGTMHYHRDVMVIAVCIAEHIIKADPEDVFIGSPPLAFTFGLGMQLVIPLYSGASTVLVEKASPPELAKAIAHFGATIAASSPTGYRFMINRFEEFELSSLKKTVSAGENLPTPTFHDWKEKTGLSMINLFGGTEMIHGFVSASVEDIRPGTVGKAVPGYTVAILDDDFKELPPGEQGHIALKGPTGCKYLADDRQKNYVKQGWNFPGDTCSMDADGYVYYHGRTDDMIISSGYNISGAEVESALLKHEAVAECAVVGAADTQRGTIVKAFVIPASGVTGSDTLTKELQAFVKDAIAPYKYPRAIDYVNELPKTHTGKIKRHILRDR